MQRPRKHIRSFEERLERHPDDVTKRAVQLPPGEERDALMKKQVQTERAIQICAWLSRPQT
jgi:hypothetical protein